MPRTGQPRYDQSRNQWYLNHKNKKHFLGTGRGNYAQAIKRAAEILGHDPLPVPSGRPRIIATMAEAWIHEHSPSDWVKAMLKTWLVQFGAVPLDKVGPGHLQEYANWLRSHNTEHTTRPTKWTQGRRPKRPSARTVQANVNAAKRVLDWGHRRGLVGPVDPPKLETPTKQPRDYRPHQLAKLWETLPKYVKPALAFLVETGARPGEVCNLDWSDVDIEAGVAEVAEHKTRHRTGQSRKLFLSPAAIEVLKAIKHRKGPVFLNRNRRVYKPSGLRSTVYRYAKRLGLSVKTVYGLRHTRAQTMLEQGHDLAEVKEQLGHRSIVTTQRYAQVRDDQSREVAKTLTSPLPPTPPPDTDDQTLNAETQSPATTKRTRHRRASGHVA